ncbi:MAG: AAA family ATPase [Pseudomonadota bacterium]
MTQSLRVQINAEGGRGIVRLSRRLLAELSLTPGDLVSIEGGRRTYGRAVPGRLADGCAQLDAALAQNARVPDESTVTLVRTELPRLQSVVLRFADSGAKPPLELKDALFDVALAEGDLVPLAHAPSQKTIAEVVAVSPSPAGVVGEETTISLQTPPDPAFDYEGIGGLREQIAQVHDLIAAPLLRPELYDRLGIAAPRGVLFSGPPGSGKTLLARAVAHKTEAAFFHVNGPEIVTKHYGESEAALRKVFEAARKAAPAVIFIDEIDAIAPKRSDLSAEKQVERRVVAQLLTLLDGLAERGRVVVMAATNLPDDLDPALRRPGRFDREVAFVPPSLEQRAEILAVHLKDAPLATDVDLARLAAETHGYVGADLAALAREAAVAALTRAISVAGSEKDVRVQDLVVAQVDLEAGLKATAPSTLRGSTVEHAAVQWSDVGGMDTVKEVLKDAVSTPLKHAATYARFGLRPTRGILLCGPPGSGKTLTARALAGETGMNFIPVRPPKLLSQFFGAAEQAVADLFKTSRLSAPTLLFFDEFDAIAPRRSGKDTVNDRIVAQFLMELDGMLSNDGVVVLAATNRPDAIDPALTRPGRFDLVVDFPYPDAGSRQAILSVHLKDRPIAEDVDLTALAAQTEGLNGADLALLAEDAARSALRRHLQTGEEAEVCAFDFAEALSRFQIGEVVRQKDYIGKGFSE